MYETHHLTQSTQYTNFKPFVRPQTGNLQPSCAVDLCARSRRGKLNLASAVEMEEEESGGAPAKIKKSWCKLNNSWTENVISCLKAVNNGMPFAKGKMISQHIKSQRYIRVAEAQKGNTCYTQC